MFPNFKLKKIILSFNLFSFLFKLVLLSFKTWLRGILVTLFPYPLLSPSNICQDLPPSPICPFSRLMTFDSTWPNQSHLYNHQMDIHWMLIGSPMGTQRKAMALLSLNLSLGNCSARTGRASWVSLFLSGWIGSILVQSSTVAESHDYSGCVLPVRRHFMFVPYPLALTAQYSLSLGVVTEVPCLGAMLSTFTYAQAPSEVIGFTTVHKIEEKLLQLRSKVIIVRC